MKNGIRSFIHVFIQFASLAFLFFTGQKFHSNILIIPELLGIFLGSWSILVMRKSVLTIFPNPQIGFMLIEKGPYKFIRHPMYTALFLVVVPWVIGSYSNIRLVVLIIFIANQIVKLYYEEGLILRKHPEYFRYVSKTKRIIPFIF